MVQMRIRTDKSLDKQYSMKGYEMADIDDLPTEIGAQSSCHDRAE